jgi:hypothetical protein
MVGKKSTFSLENAETLGGENRRMEVGNIENYMHVDISKSATLCITLMLFTLNFCQSGQTSWKASACVNILLCDCACLVLKPRFKYTPRQFNELTGER